MHHFTMVPTSSGAKSFEISAFDDASILYVLSRKACGETAIFEGGKYRYSLSLTSAGGWRIFQRQHSIPVPSH